MECSSRFVNMDLGVDHVSTIKGTSYGDSSYLKAWSALSGDIVHCTPTKSDIRPLIIARYSNYDEVNKDTYDYSLFVSTQHSKEKLILEGQYLVVTLTTDKPGLLPTAIKDAWDSVRVKVDLPRTYEADYEVYLTPTSACIYVGIA